MQTQNNDKQTFRSKKDALMKFDEQWEHIASRGHVLLSHVDAYRHKTNALLPMIGAGIVFVILSIFIPERASALISVPIGKIAGFFEKTSEAPVLNPAVNLLKVTPNLPATVTSIDTMPTADVINSALAAAVKQLKNGKEIDGCDTASKITGAWAPNGNFAPHCRYSADKNRTWVWGVMSTQNSYAPFFSLIRKNNDGHVVVYNVAGAQRVGNYDGLEIGLVPRAVASDFPELIKNAEVK